MNRINAIYARQSVDRADSISIESQIEFCKYELKGGSFREYKDRGYSGKIPPGLSCSSFLRISGEERWRR